MREDNVSVKSKECVVYNGERRIEFNDGWRFQRELEGNFTNVQALTFEDASWRKLRLPHDWSIELDFNAESPATHEAGYLDGGVAWYRKTFSLPTSMKGKRISIDFDGVYMDSTTYLNGELIGSYPFGYNAFSYDLTDKLFMDGRENVLVVKVNNTQPSSRWYSGSGIYRNVYLTVTDPVHIARYGTFITTPTIEQTHALGYADVYVKTNIQNDTAAIKSFKVKSTIYDEALTKVATMWSDEETITADDTITLENIVKIDNPQLWEMESPHRYLLVTEVFVGEQIVDTYETRFGIRYFNFDAQEGFSFNGRYTKLHGVCMHHDLGALGAATNARAVERQLQMMQDMGVNSIRVTHNPASPELLEAANNLGLLVVEEAFDSWNQSKKTYDYSRFFTTWAEHDIKEMVDRGKNEPSIIMWSIGNEIYDTTSESGVEIAKDLVRWVKEIDMTRPTTIGEDKTRGDKVNVTPLNPHIQAIFDIVDIVGLNYTENNYAGYHELHPEWKIYGAETSSATRSRGVYTHPYEYNQSTQYEDLQQSSYDNDFVGWGRTAEDAWKYDRDLKHIAGQYIWTGFDYIGEPTPYYNTFPAKSSYFGAVDTAGFPKDIFYYYQSQWTQEPMLHILPHWNWTEGETVRVLAYTNAHTVELFLNGKSLGERRYVVKTTAWGTTYKETEAGDTYLEWAVPFEKGTLTAIGKDAQGQIIVEDQVVTAGEPARLQLTADRQMIDADGKDVSFITVDVVDRDGHIVPTANHSVTFDISGMGELVGVDNGNASSIERYKTNHRKTFNGKALAIVQAGEEAGTITLRATAEGLAGDETILTVTQPIEQAIHPTSKLVKVELLSDQIEVIEDESLAFTTIGQLEDGAKIDLSAVQSTYTFTEPIVQVVGGQLVAIAEGTVDITATGMFKGTQFTTTACRIVIRPNTIEKTITDIEPVALVVDEWQVPHLPENIQVHYSVGVPRDVAVDWGSIAAVHKDCQVIGTIAGTTLTAIAEITVRKIVAVEQVTIALLCKQLPELPEVVTVYMNDHTEKKLPVKWEDVSSEQFATVGYVDIQGVIEERQIPVKASIRVTDEIGREQNISRAKNGYDYPQAAASYTNEEPNTEDKVAAIHDDLISYEALPHNRWTNWHENHRPTDWVSVTFGDYGPVEHEVDQIVLHWYEDDRASYPQALTIQYKDGDRWINVENMRSEYPSMMTETANTYYFDRVKTTSIRVEMTAQTNLAIAITELSIFAKWPKWYTVPHVTSITLGSEQILASFQGGDRNDVFNFYTSQLEDIQAIGTDNTSTTIIPTTAVPGTTTIIAKSEDGKKEVRYHIHFSG